ncbi:MAG: DUF6893 family small protein [Chthoniobacterales bacterium]
MRREFRPLNDTLAVLGLIAVFVGIQMIPEMRRYLRMRRM